jgi:murein DD-endopeptidase MepM/ murein hydrolase activator NlpD
MTSPSSFQLIGHQPNQPIDQPIDQEQFFASFSYSPVIDLPSDYEVYDFSAGYDSERELRSAFGIGRYNERRPGMYVSELFRVTQSDAPSSASTNHSTPHEADQSSLNVRDIHVGIDIAAPVGTPVRAFFDGCIYLVGINPAEGDYGGTMITEHRLGDRVVWALHGHLSHASVARWETGKAFSQGEVLGWVGERHENGGWNPHLHFQLSWLRPERCDLPGAVSQLDREAALQVYPDPRWVLGPLY